MSKLKTLYPGDPSGDEHHGNTEKINVVTIDHYATH